jgi:hydroxymethylpyrimidine pyrophosphatase-like HAD family hydrolase
MLDRPSHRTRSGWVPRSAAGLAMARPDLVALDVDGTVVEFDGALSSAVQEAVRRTAAAGTHLVIATGRSMHGTLPVCDALGLQDGFAVCSNGAVTVDVATRLPVEVVTFDATESVRYFAEQVPDALLAVEELGIGYRVTGEFPAGELDGRMTVVPHDELLVEPASRLIARLPEGDREEFTALAHAAGLHGVSYAIGYDAWIDFMPEGVSKASGLEVVRERLGVPVGATLAVGDGHNDLEMLRWAGLGVAMGQAAPDVQATADEVAPSVEEDGLAAVLAHWF